MRSIQCDHQITKCDSSGLRSLGGLDRQLRHRNVLGFIVVVIVTLVVLLLRHLLLDIEFLVATFFFIGIDRIGHLGILNHNRNTDASALELLEAVVEELFSLGQIEGVRIVWMHLPDCNVVLFAPPSIPLTNNKCIKCTPRKEKVSELNQLK